MIGIVKQNLSRIFNRLSIIRGDIHRNDRHGGLFRAWGHVFTNQLVGDYVEFGVYQGGSVVSSLNLHRDFSKWLKGQSSSAEQWRKEYAKLSPLNDTPVFHCLDTFEGMPDNDEGSISFRKGNFASDFEKTKNFIGKNNLNDVRIEYYKGLFSDTTEQFRKNLNGRCIAIANIDCDLEQSTRDALCAIRENITVGTVLLFDDYNCFNANNQKGQRKAFADFQKDTEFEFEKFFTYHFAGQAFLIVDRK